MPPVPQGVGATGKKTNYQLIIHPVLIRVFKRRQYDRRGTAILRLDLMGCSMNALTCH